MSIKACQSFLELAYESPNLKRELKVVTGAHEMVRLGRRHGYVFELEELIETSSASASTSNGHRQVAPEVPSPPSTGTAFYHHEFDLADLAGFETVLEELPNLKVMPDTVDLTEFDRSFREDDCATTEMSPAEPAFRSWHESMMKAHWRDPSHGQDGPRRDFHLVNLDDQIAHSAYDRYFDSKVQTVSVLEQLFGDEVQFSGSMWYPPRSYRLWHTNESQPGWRMYIVDLDDDFPSPDETSFFRYMNPETKEIVTLRERPRIVRFFRINQDPNALFWHCIVNATTRHRWSFGFSVPDSWIENIRITGSSAAR